MTKLQLRIAPAVASAAIALAALACGGRGMMMSNDQMTEQMQKNPQMMQQMMQQMHKDPQMMQRMMEQMHKDPRMMQQMSEWMLADPQHCALMAEQMSKNPEACRNMMKAIAQRMDGTARQQMMQHCETMTRGATSTSAPTAVPSSSTSAGTSPEAPTPSAAVQEFTVSVSGSGFSPSSLSVRKGQPVRLHFRRDGRPTCADEVVFADLNIRKALRPNATTTVDITPVRGELTFACGMNMFQGKLVASS